MDKLKEFVMIIIMLIVCLKEMNCCLESERLALLQLKDNLFPNMLSNSWGNNLDDCCSLDEIECNSATGHVISLDLSLIRDWDSYKESSHYYLNASLFLPFQHLKELYFADNEIDGCIENEGFERLSALANLELLDLTGNKLNNSILPSLSALPNSLKSLGLIGNNLNGTINISGLCQLKHLQELNLATNDLNGNLPWCLGNLTSLEILDISRNQLSGNLPSSLATSTSLRELDLSYNQFSGNLHWSHGNWTSLEKLDLSFNHLSGNLPWFLANSTSLRYLDLSKNQLSGNISLSPLQCLTSLELLDLSDNHFQIPISLTLLFNLSKLNFLYFDNNIIFTEIEDHNLIPKFQIISLSLHGYGEVGAIPKFLYHQRSLQSVEISNVKLRGVFPYWLLENNTVLDTLNLANNSLSGPLLLPNIPHSNLNVLDISDNCFGGYIPSQIGAYFPGLFQLDMSHNEFKGGIPFSLCNITGLKILDMSQNNITGTIPTCIGKLPELGVLDLSNNNIFGSLPSNFSSTFISVVKLSKNRLQGSLKGTFYYCSSQLILLDISHNNFSGSIPSWIERFSQLSFLLLGNNNFEGKIPNGFCMLKQLSFLDISHNRISGHMISCLNFTSYWSRKGGILEIERGFISIPLEFTVKGHTYSYEAKILSYMSGIDTSSNILTGHIPPEIGNLENIETLNFSHNSLSGTIPPTFSNLKEIESLDLSSNNLQGTIPRQLTQLKGIAVFNVSYNNLSGRTPDNVAQFATFDESSYEGNPFLCGWPLSKNCSDQVDLPPSTTTSSTHNEERSNSFIDMEAFYASFGVSYGIVLMTIVGVLCINPYWRRVWFHYVQMSIDNSYYFIIDNVPFLSRFKFSKCFRRIYRYVRD